MTIRIEAYDRCPAAARAIREQVFIRERDWRPEFDEWDAASVHLLVFDSDNDAPNRPGSSAQLASRSQPIQPSQNHPVATCRFYADPDHPDQPGRYVIARLAVLPEAQGCFASMFVRQVRQCFSVVWADGFPRCRHRFPVM